MLAPYLAMMILMRRGMAGKGRGKYVLLLCVLCTGLVGGG